LSLASAESLVADLHRRGVEFRADGDLIRWRAPRGVLGSRELDELAARKPELLELLRAPEGRRTTTLRPHRDSTAAEPFDRFLADASVLVAVFHSRALDRDFIVAQHRGTLSALTEPDHGLQVLYFADCQSLGGALLDSRAELGLEVALVELRPAAAVQ
jgi:hypothetical protein